MKRHCWHRLLIGLVASIMLILPMNIAIANASAAQSRSTLQPDIQAVAGIAIDAKTGQLLYAKNPDKPMPLASMSKLLSFYVILQALHSGKIKMNQRVTIPKDIHDLSVDHTYANVPLALHKQYKVSQLYQASFESANAAMMMLAKLVGGTTQHFVMMMRNAAKKLGLNNVSIYTPCGLTNGEVGKMGFSNINANAENKMSARDMAILAKTLIHKYPEILKATSVPSYTLGGTTIKNGDYMLKGGTQYTPDLPVQGMKTGTSDTAGGSFTGTTNRDGHRIITVVLHASNRYQTDPGRFIQTKRIMYYVYDHYQYVRAGSLSHNLIKQVLVPNGEKLKVGLKTTSPLYYWIAKDGKTAGPQLDFKSSLKDGNGLVAPLKNNQYVGLIKLPGIYDVYDQQIQAPVYTTASVDKAGFFTKLWRSIQNLF